MRFYIQHPNIVAANQILQARFNEPLSTWGAFGRHGGTVVMSPSTHLLFAKLERPFSPSLEKAVR